MNPELSFPGPSYAIDTACSSSLLALDQALHSIQSGQCDAAIVGGSNLNLKGFQKWIWYLLSLIYLSFHTYCQWKNFRNHLLLLVKSINILSLPLRTISACILRYYVIEATQVTVCYSAYAWFSNFDKYTVLLWFCCTWTTKMQTSLSYLTGWSAPLLFNISEVQ